MSCNIDDFSIYIISSTVFEDVKIADVLCASPEKMGYSVIGWQREKR